jgi:hypothetical protein
VFTDTDGSVYSYDDLCAEVKARQELGQPTMQITGSFTGDPLSSGSARCKVYWNKQTGLTVVDFKVGETHRLIRDDDPALDALFGELLKKQII